MTITTITEAMNKAGVQTDEARLYNIAVDALREVDLFPNRALLRFEQALADTPVLRRALAMEYLTARANEMKGIPAGGGHAVSDVQRKTAPAAPVPNGEVAGQIRRDAQTRRAPSSPPNSGGDTGSALSDAHGNRAQPPGPSRAGAGQSPLDARAITARPVREPSKAQRKATADARKVIAKSIFDREIGGGIKARGSTRQDWINVKIKGSIMGHVADRVLSEVEWTDTATLEQLIDEKAYSEILNSGYKLLDAMGVSNAR